MNNTTKHKALKISLIAVAILLIGVSAYTYRLYNNAKETKKELIQEKQLVLNDLNEMAVQYDTAIGDNELANSKLLEAKQRIESLVESLETSEGTIKNLRVYRSKFSVLEKEMQVLLTENKTLKAENSSLSTSLNTTRTELNERLVFTDSLLTQNVELAELVNNASVLSTNALKGFGVIVRSSGKLTPTEKARRVDKIRVCYTVIKNSLVEAGDKEFYLQVLAPDNTVLGLKKQVKFADQTISYSLVSKFNYENNNLNICEFLDLENNEKFKKGSYKVTLFDKDKLVSSTEFSLK